MLSQTVNVFVSYSHADAALVGPVVRLLRVNKSLVFQDADGISPGKRWRDEIARALTESNLVVVFWCGHACRSAEVSSEWKAAIDQGKDLLPLLLDATPLPAPLGQFQWIDFRATVGSNHGSVDSPVAPSAAPVPPVAPRPRRALGYTLAGAAAVAAVVLFSSRLWNGEDSRAFEPIPYFDWILLLLAIVVALGASRLSRRSHASLGKRLETASPRHEDVERRIAVELESEILRRTASARYART